MITPFYRPVKSKKKGFWFFQRLAVVWRRDAPHELGFEPWVPSRWYCLRSLCLCMGCECWFHLWVTLYSVCDWRRDLSALLGDLLIFLPCPRGPCLLPQDAFGCILPWPQKSSRCTCQLLLLLIFSLNQLQGGKWYCIVGLTCMALVCLPSNFGIFQYAQCPFARFFVESYL